jgi:hypothetical protein
LLSTDITRKQQSRIPAIKVRISGHQFKDLNMAYAAHGDRLKADMWNYTNIQPIVQVNDVVIEKYAARNCLMSA